MDLTYVKEAVMKVAVMATHGKDGQFEYLTVGIQDKGVYEGGRLLDSRVFYAKEYETIDALLHAAHDYAKGQGVATTAIVQGEHPPAFEVGTGRPCIRLLNSFDVLRGQVEQRREPGRPGRRE